MASYTLVASSIRVGGRIEYHLQLNPDESVLLTYDTAQTQETLDAKCDEIVAFRKEEAEKQAKIDKAIAEALWTDEERANLG